MDSARDYERTGKSPRRYDRYDDYDTRKRHSSRAPRSKSRHRPRRRWPPPPKVENEQDALAAEYRPILSTDEESQSKGSIDQQPMIEDAFPTTSTRASYEPSRNKRKGDPRDRKEWKDTRDPPTQRPNGKQDRPHFESSSSSESLGPKTPIDQEPSNLDRRYVFVPEKGTEIPITYDEPREPIFRASTETPSQDVRGRKSKPVLGVDTLRDPSPEEISHRERAPLPYAFTPVKKENETPRMNRFSGDYLLSPDLMSPKVNNSRNSPRQASADPRMMNASKGHTRESSLKDLPKPARPSMRRHASAITESSGRVPTMGHSRHSSSHILSSSDSDYSPDESRKARKSKESSRKPKGTPRNEESKTYRSAFSDGPSRAGTDSEGSKRHTPTFTPPRTTGVTGPALHAANILLTNPHYGRRAASPRGSPMESPTMSPNASPPGTPPNERSHKLERDHPLRHPLATSKPASPLHSPPLDTPKVRFAHGMDSGDGRHTQAVDFDCSSRRERSPRPPMPRSRQTSPLPALGASKLDFGPSINVRSPSPYLNRNPQPDARAPSPSGRRRSSSHSGVHPGPTDNSTSPSRQRSKTTLRSEDERPSSRHLSLAPFDLPSAPSNKSSENTPRRRAHSSVNGSRPDIKDLAPSSRRTNSVAPQTRYTPPLCPRTVPQIGHHDWSITRDGPSSLVICATCRQIWSSFHDFAYRHLVPAPRSLTEKPTRCNFTDPWIQLAWQKLQTMGKPDIDVLYDVADNLADEEPCPDNTATSRRTWYRVIDPSTGEQISGFDVCGTCFTNIDILWPSSADAFRKSNSRHSGAKRLCALRPSSGRRFGIFTEVLAEMSNQAHDSRKVVDTRQLIDHIHRLRDVRECRREKLLEDEYWHIIPSLEEFTVCEDCFQDVVEPKIRQGSSIAGKFERKSRKLRKREEGSRRGSRSDDLANSDKTNKGKDDEDEIPKLLSCQLYSERMRKIFDEACASSDMKFLEDKAWDRFDAERDLAYRRERAADFERGEREREIREVEKEWKDVE